MSIIIILVCVIIILIVCKVYAIVTLGKCKCTKHLHGKTVIVTGSNQGIGYEVALDLAKRGARVIITSENEVDCHRAKEKLIKETGNTNIVSKFLDLRSLDVVRSFAKDILATESRLDILINNAGTTGLGKNPTKDGIIPGMQVNHLGPFLLTNLLLGLLKKSRTSRIINVASVLSQFTFGFQPENINCCKWDDLYEMFVYCYSKYCVALTTFEMARKLEGTGVTVNCLHPGLVFTKIYSGAKYKLLDLFVYKLIGPWYFKTTKQGAQTTIHLAVSESVEGVTGKYFSDCRETSMWANKSPERIKQVWNQSVTLVKLSPEEIHCN